MNRLVSVGRANTLAAACGAALWIAAAIFLVCGIVGAASAPLVIWMETWGTAIAFWCGASVCLWRFRHSAPAAPWGWAAGACALWGYANTYYAIVLAPGVAPIPSPLDVGYALFPVVLGCALVAFGRSRSVQLSRAVLLDAGIVALGTAALATATMFGAAGARTESLASVITTVLYQAEDIILLSMLVGLGSICGWRLGHRLALFGLGIAVITAADGLAFADAFGGGTIEGAWTNLGWTVGIALIALAALWDGAGSAPEAARSRSPRSLITVPIAFGLLAIALLVLLRPLGLPTAVLPFAALALIAALARLYVLFEDAMALAESRRLSVTDDLTGLANRRQLNTDLSLAYERQERIVLALFDLDGFKRFNDTFGHVAAMGCSAISPCGLRPRPHRLLPYTGWAAMSSA